MYVIDAYQGKVKAAVRTSTGAAEAEGGMAFEASFSPDGRYFTSGCDDHTIKTWKVENGEFVGQLSTHAGCTAGACACVLGSMLGAVKPWLLF